MQAYKVPEVAQQPTLPGILTKTPRGKDAEVGHCMQIRDGSVNAEESNLVSASNNAMS